MLIDGNSNKWKYVIANEVFVLQMPKDYFSNISSLLDVKGCINGSIMNLILLLKRQKMQRMKINE